MSKFRQIDGGSQKGKIIRLYDDKCDICKKKHLEVVIDGVTKAGRWAWMCRECHMKLGFGLGVGYGQKYRRIR